MSEGFNYSNASIVDGEGNAVPISGVSFDEESKVLSLTLEEQLEGGKTYRASFTGADEAGNLLDGNSGPNGNQYAHEFETEEVQGFIVRAGDSDQYGRATIHPDLRPFVTAAPGDTTWAAAGEQHVNVPESLRGQTVKVGYRANGEPASFMATIPLVDGKDEYKVTVFTYRDMNMTPEQAIIHAEANYGFGGNSTTQYRGAKILRPDMVAYLSQKSGKYPEHFSDVDFEAGQTVIDTTFNARTEHPTSVVADTSGRFPTTEAEARGKIYIRRGDITGIAHFDFDGDGEIDYVEITIGGAAHIALSPEGLIEEFYVAKNARNFVDDRADEDLRGLSILGEWHGPPLPTEFDWKLDRLFDSYRMGLGDNLYRRQPKSEVFELQL